MQVGKYWGDSHSVFKDYGSIDLAELRPFKGSHPAVMSDWLSNEAESIFTQNPNYVLSRRDKRNRLRFWLEDKLSLEISKKHYRALD